ncbi:MAG: carboxypeptidase Y-deficient [Trizodia sp. TS-e1964]|nr:MAG: carboxypeptidase Y-deficient [Trizodia sp. TS-e1964]
MSSRPLGGGRVLGSVRSHLSVVKAPPSNSQLAESPKTSNSFVIDKQDLSSNVSLKNGDTTPTNPGLSCPICDEEMVTLLQLNRHLDDNHKNLEDVEQDEVKTWFRTQMTKAKRFQPLAVLNQKFKGLDVFESNDGPSLDAPSRGSSTSPAISTPVPDADEVVSRTHWQKAGYNDACSEPTCGKTLNVINGTINCRRCGKLFCEEHTMCQMKLSRSAQHEPIRGFWCRVCETCYRSRDGYNDHVGFFQDHTSKFISARKGVVDKANLEVARLEKRLSRLTQILADPMLGQSNGAPNLLWSLTGSKVQRKVAEQSVVAWEDDSQVLSCPLCQQEFNNYTFRRHHCRLCGRVVCGDLQTGCSSEIGFNVDRNTNQLSEKSVRQVSVDLRMCRDCKSTVFERREFQEQLAKKPPEVKAYENLMAFERGIRTLEPSFQKLLTALQDPFNTPTAAQLSEASKVRKRLIDSFTLYDIASRRIRDLPTTSSTQQKLQKAIYQQAAMFIHVHMLPLKTLPKILQHASPHGASNNIHRTNGALASIKFNGISASQASSSSAISAIESEEKELRERLIVLEEQKFFVTEMIADANRRRKFDEVSSLAQNVEDLTKEIDHVSGVLEQLDFAGAYGHSSAATLISKV